jgi:sterol desaturase/sphingolipid hydroxylase (fatty acid hydroxylase superfamily)
VFGTISAYQHTGYELPFWPNDIARFHVYHHAHNVGTFGVITTFWDWLFGTDKAYRQFLKRQMAKE